MGLDVQQIAVGGYDDNFAYLIVAAEGSACFIVDPSGSWERIAVAITANSLTPHGILITHTDFDHIDALPEALAAYPVPVYGHERGAAALAAAPTLHCLEDRATLTLDRQPIHALHTPGHADDHLCFYIPAEASTNHTPHLITGDTLFVGGCGRPTTTGVKDLYESLAELRALPPQTRLYPGHDYGPTSTSTLEHELTTNPYYQVKNFTEFQARRLG